VKGGSMFFPYGTNAPIYHFPFITIGMIVVNVALFVFALIDPESAEKLMLATGDGLHPGQWLTCNFMHAGIVHLLGNMIALWAFGLVVEGKLGWFKTLIVYLAIGVAHGALVQIVMLGDEPNFCLGASAIIYGMMAMSLIWAPENEMQCVIVFWLRPFFFDVRIKILVGILVALEVLLVVLTNARLSTEFLHTTGAVVGFAVGIAFLKAGWVDCENWDIFSVWKGRHTMTEVERHKILTETPEYKKKVADRLQEHWQELLSDFHRAIREGFPMAALKTYQRMKSEFSDWKLPDADLFALVRSMQEKKLWLESIPIMQECIEQCPASATQVRLKLAQVVLLEEKSPKKALKIMSQIDAHALDDRHRHLLEKMRLKASQTHNEDTYELAE
jgi:membrane associated rhomboid family serine protease